MSLTKGAEYDFGLVGGETIRGTFQLSFNESSGRQLAVAIKVKVATGFSLLTIPSPAIRSVALIAATAA